MADAIKSGQTLPPIKPEDIQIKLESPANQFRTLISKLDAHLKTIKTGLLGRSELRDAVNAARNGSDAVQQQLNAESKDFLRGLPAELLKEISLFSSPGTQTTLAQTSKGMKKVVDDDSVWLKRIVARYGDVILENFKIEKKFKNEQERFEQIRELITQRLYPGSNFKTAFQELKKATSSYLLLVDKGKHVYAYESGSGPGFGSTNNELTLQRYEYKPKYFLFEFRRGYQGEYGEEGHSYDHYCFQSRKEAENHPPKIDDKTKKEMDTIYILELNIPLKQLKSLLGNLKPDASIPEDVREEICKRVVRVYPKKGAPSASMPVKYSPDTREFAHADDEKKIKESQKQQEESKNRPTK